mgnify:CR=1 FL=1
MSTSFRPEQDFQLAVSDGQVEGFTHVGIFGYNKNLDNGVEAAVWPGPTALYVFPSDTGESMEIVSTQGADGQTMLVEALDQDWNTVFLLVPLEGTTPVVLPGQLSRVNVVRTRDTTATVGDVVVRAAGGGTVYALMEAVDQVTAQTVYSVPAGFRARLESPFVTVNRSGNADVSVQFRYVGRQFGFVFNTGARLGLSKRGTSAASLAIGGVAPLDPKTDVMVLAEADGNNTDVSVRLSFTLYKV